MQHEQQRRNEKPTKDPFIKYYIIWPIENVIESIIDFFKGIWHKLTGAWWCDHCETYHGRRVHKFTYYNHHVKPSQEYYVCSLGRDAILNDDEAQGLPPIRVLAAAMEGVSDRIAKVFEQIGKDLTS